MIIDKSLEMASAVALNTGAAGTYLVGSQIDTGAIVRDLGNGKLLYLVLQITTAVTSAGAATVQFILASDAQAAITTDTTETRHWTSMAFPKASLVAGFQIAIPLPMENPAYERFVGILQVTGVAALTAGAINAFLTFDPPYESRLYPDAIN